MSMFVGSSMYVASGFELKELEVRLEKGAGELFINRLSADAVTVVDSG